jgi:hypothetical protein
MYVAKRLSVTSAKFESLLFLNDREIEVRVYKDRIVIVWKK